MVIRYLGVKEVLRIHHRMITEYGGSHGVRDLGLLESAVARPKAGYNEYEAYPTVYEKAAVLLHSLIKNHAFLDGNKRTALMSCLTFLKRNRIVLKADHQELICFVIDIAKDTVDEIGISAWLQTHSQG